MQSKLRYLYKTRYRVILLFKSILFSKTNKLSCFVTKLLETKLELFYPSSSLFWDRKTKLKNPSLYFLNIRPIKNFCFD
jgi:hypothetical protein